MIGSVERLVVFLLRSPSRLAERVRVWSAAGYLVRTLAAWQRRRVRKGAVSRVLEQGEPAGEWRAEGAPYGAISLPHLLQMPSGLDDADSADGSRTVMESEFFGPLAPRSAEPEIAVSETGIGSAFMHANA